MSGPPDAPAEYVQVIVRRGHAEEEGHHGGVWKIAYADFMTAMMAFFLVMWLVNASNKDMKSMVASYFNPIKLSDNVIRKKGLLDVDGKANPDDAAKSRSNGAPGQVGKESDKEERTGPGERGVPESIHQESQSLGPEAIEELRGRDGFASNAGRAAELGRAYRDPFNPFAPGQLMSKEGAGKETTVGPIARAPVAKPEEEPAAAAPTPSVSAPLPSPDENMKLGPVGRFSTPGIAMRDPGMPGEGTKPEAGKGEGSKADALRGEGARPEAGKGDGSKPDAAKSDATAVPMSAQQLAAAAANVLRETQAAAQSIAGAGGPGIEVTVEGSGIVLSLTDTSTFGMFAIGSAEPGKQLLDLIARIAPIVAANSKRIVVRGHTDSRLYKTDKNNNWRLSVSRAEAAYAMLVRAGIDEARFARIEGHADRKLRVPKDPEAAANRRIEILLQQVPE
jgi:chemotaxis protein MotB